MARVLRDRARVSYVEFEEPSFDEYLFCTSCGDYVYEYCAIHGSLLVILDEEVPTPTGFPSYVPRAALTIPRTFLHLAPSTIPGAGIGVFSSRTLPRGVRFGPYRGMKADKPSSAYCWQIFNRSHKPAHVLDARDGNKSNWMRYVNCSRHVSEQNLVAYQYYGQLYYRTIKIIPRFTELLVFYGSESACELNVDVRRYNAPAYTETIVKSEPNGEEEKKVASIKVELNDHMYKAYVKVNVLQNPETHYNNSKDKTSIVYMKNTKQNSNGYEDKPQLEHYICDYCNQRFIKKDILITHIATHSIVTDATIINHTNINNSTSTFQKPSCTICVCKFSRKTDLINHLVKVHELKMEFKACTLCDYKTVKDKNLKDHIRRHSSISGYKCDICGYEAVTNQNLKRHKKMHSADTHSSMTCEEDRRFPCSVCGSTFKTGSILKRHLLIHTEREKSFQCLYCNKCFYYKYELNRHAKVH